MTNEFIDNIIRNYFLNIKTPNCATSLFKRRLNKLPLLSNYIDNRFEESESWKETIWRIRNNVIIKPKCKECGETLKFPFKTYCSCKCRSNNKDVRNKTKQTCLEKYGVDCVVKEETIKRKIQEALSTQRKEIYEKCKQTKFERYGNENYNNIEKSKHTKFERYGDENFTNKEKREETFMKKYGCKCSLQNEEVRRKIKQTKLEKYGDENFINHKKYKQTCLEKYGVDNSFKANEIKKKIKQTCLEKYGDENYRNVEKHKQTCLERYGVETYTQTEEFKNKVDWKKTNIKQILTKKKNGTLCTSKLEQQSYEILKVKYPDIISQYCCVLYPYNCDFYIPSLDLYIECNYHWTHGGHPFDDKNINDLNILEKWKSKNTEFYNTAIYVWSNLDVRKRETARKNNLNYIEVWTINNIYNI